MGNFIIFFVFIILRTKRLLKKGKEKKELLKLNWKMYTVHAMWKLKNSKKS